MNLDQYISELLYEHDCVIIPGFGGIVASYRSSFLNPAHHTFSAPSKRLAFNASLRNNDGLLANHLCNRLSINYQEANFHINGFVEDCMLTLKDGKKLLIEKIGQLYLDNEQNLQFVADSNANYLKSSFGLYTIHTPAVRRITEKYDSPIENIIRTKKTKSRVKRFAWRIIEVIPAAAILVLLVLNPNVIQRLNQQAASINPFSSSSTDSIARLNSHSKMNADVKKKTNAFDLPPKADNDLEKKSAFEMADRGENIETTRKPVPVIVLKSSPSLPNENSKPVETIEKKEEPVVINKKESTTPVSTVKSNTKLYYVIGGCFGVFENATGFRDDMIAEGFQAAIIGQNEKGLHMVSLYSSPDNKSALNELALIQEKAQTSAWLFRK